MSKKFISKPLIFINSISILYYIFFVIFILLLCYVIAFYFSDKPIAVALSVVFCLLFDFVKNIYLLIKIMRKDFEIIDVCASRIVRIDNTDPESVGSYYYESYYNCGKDYGTYKITCGNCYPKKTRHYFVFIKIGKKKIQRICDFSSEKYCCPKSLESVLKVIPFEYDD